MRKNDFLNQFPIPIDTTEIGFDILGIPEVRTFFQGGGRFEVDFSITAQDIIEAYKKKDVELPYQRYIVSDVKQEKMISAIEKLRLMVCEDFEKQIKIITDARSYFYIPKERIVQFVHTPVSYIDLPPGSTTIHFRVFTERWLGEVEEDA